MFKNILKTFKLLFKNYWFCQNLEMKQIARGRGKKRRGSCSLCHYNAMRTKIDMWFTPYHCLKVNCSFHAKNFISGGSICSFGTKDMYFLKLHMFLPVHISFQSFRAILENWRSREGQKVEKVLKVKQDILFKVTRPPLKKS